MPLHLLIVGASARAAAFSAVRAGYRVSAADRFGDADLRRLCAHYLPLDDGQPTPETCITNVAWGRDAPQAWLYTGGLENHPRVVDRLAARLPLYGNPGHVLARVRRPDFFFEVCRQAGLPTPRWQTDSRSLPRDGSWLRKRITGSGGLHVRPWMGPDALPAQEDRATACEASPANTAALAQPRLSAAAGSTTFEPIAPACYYQQHIEGLPASALYVAANRRSVLLAVSQQWIGTRYGAPQPFAYAGSIGPLRLAPAVLDQLCRLGNLLAARADLVGLFGVDFILQNDLVWPLEINPRYTASAEIIEPDLPQSAIALHVDACRYGRLPHHTHPGVFPSASLASATPGDWYAKRIVYASRDLRIQPRQTATLLACRGDGSLPRLADIPAAGTHIARHAPLATVLAHGASRDEAQQAIAWQTVRLHALLQ